MFKAIFFDIDGTLVPLGSRHMPESTFAALETLRRKGVRLFIASGRPPQYLQNLPEALKSFPFDGYVLCNGQCCTDAYLDPFYLEALPRASLAPVLDWLEENPDVVCHFVEYRGSYLNRLTPEHAALHPEDKMVGDPRRCLDHATYQLNPFVSAERERELLARAPGLASVRWCDDFSDIIPASGGKEKGIARMLARFGLAASEAMAFGDGGNDIAMLRYAGIGVAMGSAPQDVKAAADYVTGAASENGIANALQHFGLL